MKPRLLIWAGLPVALLVLAACGADGEGTTAEAAAGEAPPLASDPTLRQAQIYLECGGGDWPLAEIDQSEEGEPFSGYVVPAGLTVYGFPVEEAGAGQGIYARVRGSAREVFEAARARYPNAQASEFDEHSFQLYNLDPAITDGIPTQTMGINGDGDSPITTVSCGG